MKLVSQISKNHIVELLLTPSYLTFVLSVFTSQVAFNMLTVVLVFLIFHLTSSNFAVSILLFTVLVPQIALSFIGGVIADTHNKKVILIVGNILRAAVLVLLFYSWQSPLAVYLIALIVSIITQFYVPAESPLIPKLVKPDRLVAANSLFGIGLFGSILIGYVAAGPVISSFGRGQTFLILAGIFVLATIFASLIPQEKPEKKEIGILEDAKKTLFAELRASLNLLAKTKQVADAFFLLIFSQIIVFILATLIPGYATSLLQVPAEEISIIVFAPAAIGMLISSFLLGGVFHKIPKERITTVGIFISGLVLMLLPFTSRLISQGIIVTINLILPPSLDLNVFNFVLILAFLAGAANALIFIPSQATIQEVIPESYRSKIYGLLFALIGLFSLIPIMAAGGVADLVGVGAVFFTLGIIIIILGVVRRRILRGLQK